MKKIVTSQKYQSIFILAFVLLACFVNELLEISYFNGTISPKDWVRIVLISLAFFSLALWLEKEPFKPVKTTKEHSVKNLKIRAALFFLILFYGLLLQSLGYFLLTPIIIYFTSKMCGASKKNGIIVAISLTLLIYGIFDLGLDIYLPKGDIWSVEETLDY